LLNRFQEIGVAFRMVTSSTPNLVVNPLVPEAMPAVDFWWLQPSVSRPATAGFWLLACPFMLEVVMSAYRIRKVLNQTGG
jgi:hypothetical protein